MTDVLNEIAILTGASLGIGLGIAIGQGTSARRDPLDLNDGPAPQAVTRTRRLVPW
jgi:hypothetical protein